MLRLPVAVGHFFKTLAAHESAQTVVAAQVPPLTFCPTMFFAAGAAFSGFHFHLRN